MKFKTLITAVFVLSVFNFAQAQLAMGKWRTHLAFNSVVQIAQSENKIFAVRVVRCFRSIRRRKILNSTVK